MKLEISRSINLQFRLTIRRLRVFSHGFASHSFEHTLVEWSYLNSKDAPYPEKIEVGNVLLGGWLDGNG